MRVIFGAVALLLFLQSTTIGKKHKMKTSMQRRRDVLSDAVLEVEPLPPDVMQGECTCRCCEQPPAPLVASKCPNDIVMAVDSSACFRDQHSRMMRFLKKLVRRIGRTPNIQYGGDETRLALMQFSSDILFPLELSSFEDYTNPSTRKGIMDGINEQLENLRFLGEGSFLNKALNATAEHIEAQPRPQDILDRISPKQPRSVVILMTNGKSHPDVSMSDIESSISGLEAAGLSVLPVAVTRECHGMQSDEWNEGLCPDTVILNKLAKVGREETTSFMEMTSQDTIPDIINFLEACRPKALGLTAADLCNNCTCSCELPIGPQGPRGLRGQKGDFVQGDPGEDGDIGPKGEVGPKGDEGQRGEKGDGGDIGADGPKGDTGDIGPKGDKGDDGEKGDVGPPGIGGDIGFDGPIGDIGDKGDKGEVGDKGDLGDKGDFGDKGEVGEKGDIGETGPKGDKGVGIKGDTGDEGPIGPKGMLGDKGDTGDQGDTGDRGLCGKPGPAGKPGIEGIGGVDGVDGLEGPPGSQGPRGETGEPGDKGGNGDAGEPGTPGRRGLPGERGPEGPLGERGFKGEKGDPSVELGPAGLPGIPGLKGEPGSDGADGLEGLEGPPGRQGSRGLQGERGLPGVYDLDVLRPIIVDMIRELLPGECGSEDTSTAPTDNTFPATTSAQSSNDEDDICAEDPPFENCLTPGDNGLTGKYYWSKLKQDCVLFFYKRCGGGNVFDTRDECRKRCSRTTTQTTPPPPVIPIDPGCYNAVSDIAFVVDGSASVGEDGFDLIQVFLTNVVSSFHNVGRDGVQVAMIQYNAQPRLEFDFDQSENQLIVLEAIDGIEYLSGNTKTGLALELARQTFGGIVQGSRPNSRRVAVAITDGRSQDDVAAPSLALRNEGVTMFAIGVGEAELIELRQIASHPTSNYVYTVQDYAAITSIQDSLVSRICDLAEGNYKAPDGFEPTIEEDQLIPGTDSTDPEGVGADYDEGSGEIEFAF